MLKKRKNNGGLDTIFLLILNNSYFSVHLLPLVQLLFLELLPRDVPSKGISFLLV